MEILIVVDMQNDFINGSLGTPEAENIISNVVNKIRTFKGTIFFTRDTHTADYLSTQEGKKLPVLHCIKGTKGWMLHPDIENLRHTVPFDKPSFGSLELAETLKDIHLKTPIDSITLIGLCTDICIISNSILIKTFLPEVPVLVDASCCAGTTPENHRRALMSMSGCQIQIL